MPVPVHIATIIGVRGTLPPFTEFDVTPGQILSSDESLRLKFDSDFNVNNPSSFTFSSSNGDIIIPMNIEGPRLTSRIDIDANNYWTADMVRQDEWQVVSNITYTFNGNTRSVPSAIDFYF